MKTETLASSRTQEIMDLHKARVGRRNRRALPKNILIYAFMTGLAFLFMLPIFWICPEKAMIKICLKSVESFLSGAGVLYDIILDDVLLCLHLLSGCNVQNLNKIC